MPDRSQCWGKTGYYPGARNGGAALNSVHCDNSVTGMLVINGAGGAKRGNVAPATSVEPAVAL